LTTIQASGGSSFKTSGFVAESGIDCILHPRLPGNSPVHHEEHEEDEEEKGQCEFFSLRRPGN
jgi:hypothetical protein